MSKLTQTLSQYSELTYLVELVALGLVALALLAVTFSIIRRLKTGQREQKKMLSLRRSVEKDKEAADKAFSEIDGVGKQIKETAKEADMHLVRAAKKVREAEKHAETVANIEVEMKQAVDGTTERMIHIQEHWEFLLKETTESMDAIKTNLKEGVVQAAKNSEQTTAALHALNETATKVKNSADIPAQLKNPVNKEIQETLDLTLAESKELLAQIQAYQQQAKTVFTSFTSTLSGFESQAHEQFDEVFNTADVARQELNANLDESREYLKIFRKDNPEDQEDNQTKNNNNNNNKDNTKYTEENTKKETSEKNRLILKGIDTDRPVKKKSKSGQPVQEVKSGSYSSKVTIKEGVERVKAVSASRDDRPLLGVNDVESLTNKNLISKEYDGKIVSKALEADDKNLISLFTRFKQHGA